MRMSTRECHGDGLSNSFDGRLLFLENQHEVNEIPHTAVRRLARTGVRVKLLCPVLLDGQRRHDNRRDAGETEPVLTLNTLERLQHVIADAEINVEPDERSTVEAGVNGESRAALWSLIEVGHHFADLEHEEVRQLHRRGDQKSLPQRRRGFNGALTSSNSQVEVLRRTRPQESHFERVAAFQDPTIANGL